MGTAVAERPKSVLLSMAQRFDMEPAAFEATVRATCMKPDRQGREPSREEFAAFLLVAREYDLNPLTKEIHAFTAKGGGVVPVVGIDGWSSLINRNPYFDGMEFDDQIDDKGLLYSVTCRMYRKDRSRPIQATEYMVECRRDTDVWRQWPRRMLRHKAMIQAARYAFGFSGIYDPDEAERISETDMRDVSPRRAPPPPTVASPPIAPEKAEEPPKAKRAPPPPAEPEIIPPKREEKPVEKPSAMEDDEPPAKASDLPRLIALMNAAKTEDEANDVYANEDVAISCLTETESDELAKAYDAKLAELRPQEDEAPQDDGPLPLPRESRETWKADCFAIMAKAKTGQQIFDWWQSAEHKEQRTRLGIPQEDRAAVVKEGERLRGELG